MSDADDDYLRAQASDIFTWVKVEARYEVPGIGLVLHVIQAYEGQVRPGALIRSEDKYYLVKSVDRRWSLMYPPSVWQEVRLVVREFQWSEIAKIARVVNVVKDLWKEKP